MRSMNSAVCAVAGNLGELVAGRVILASTRKDARDLLVVEDADL